MSEESKSKLKFQSDIVSFCPNCGAQFETAQPEANSNGIVECPEEEGGCGTRFRGIRKLDD